MDTAVLPGTLRNTSRIGFGTAGLTGELSRKESIALLEAAFDAGITHFDTAPLYGAGESEKVLGEFLYRKHSKITVTTKFGLMPPRGKPMLLFGKNMLRPMLRRIPALKPRLAKSLAGLSRAPSYSSADMVHSLKTSLRALRCECIDLFLLHEADVASISDELRKALDDAVRFGFIGAWGVGGSRDKIDRVAACAPAAARVLQFEWSVLSDRPPVYENSFCITFGALSSAFARFSTLLTDPEHRRRWSDDIGVDFTDPRILPRLLIAGALAANPNSIVLFSSKKSDRIRETAALPHSGVSLARFLALVERECLKLVAKPAAAN
jgi:D-threo-aldose 1-dehydrogenase